MKETKTVEFKEIVSNSFLKIVSAYANYGTGTIVFGISDTGKKKGLKDIDAEKLNIENAINGNIKPVPVFSLESTDKIITLTVYKGEATPYLYKNKAYKRSDTSTVEVDNTELKRLILEGQHINFESISAQNQKLTFNYFSHSMANNIDVKIIDINILKTLQLYTNEGGYNIAAYLLSDNLSGVGIDIVKYGSSIDIIEKRFQVLEGSILEQFSKAEEIFRDYYIVEKITGLQRVPTELIPIVAFREAVANAIVHRKWDMNANIQISMYSDQIEIVSPGSLLPEISKTEFLEGKFSSLRNPIIADIFFRLGLIEKFGTGIRRIKNAYKGKQVSPEFEILDNSITVSLPIIKEIPCTADEKIVLKCINSVPVSSSELIRLTGFEKSKLLRLIHSLLDKKLIVSQGRGRAVKYIEK